MRWLNEYSRTFLSKWYLREGITAEERIMEIAKTAEKILWKPGWANKFYDYMSKWWYSLSSPVWSNFGLERWLPISCFWSYIWDDMWQIMYSQAEVGMMTKLWWWTSWYFWDLRPSWSPITDNWKSSWPVHFMQLFESLLDVVSQWSVRRWSFAPYLPLEHKDIEDFLKIWTEWHPIQDMKYGITVTDQWLNEMIWWDKDKRKIWAKVIEIRSQIWYPYILFSDNVNNWTVDAYKDNDHKIYASNLCFTWDTMVAVADWRNAISIKQLAEESNWVVKFPVYSWSKCSRRKVWKKTWWMTFSSYWNTEIKNAVAFKTGTKKVLKVTLSNWDIVRCTEDHKLWLFNWWFVKASESLWKELQPFFSFTSKDNWWKYRHINSLTNWYSKQHLMIWDHYNWKNWVQNWFHIDHINKDIKYIDSINNLQKLSQEEHFKKTWQEFSWLWNAMHNRRDKNINLYNQKIASSWKNNARFSWINNFELIEFWKYIYQKYGKFNYKTYLLLKEEWYNIPIYFSNYRFWWDFNKYINYVKWIEIYDWSFDIENEKLKYPSLDEERINYIHNHFVEIDDKNTSYKWLTVVWIIEDWIEDVYDLTVEDNHNFYIITSTEDNNYENCQWILVHNCSEIALPSNERWSFVCCLSSMNLLHWDEWKNTDAVEVMVEFLDAVMEEFIQKLENMKVSADHRQRQIFHFMERAYTFAKENRALWLWVLWYHSLLQSKLLPIDSKEAAKLNYEIFKDIKEKAYLASEKLAKEFWEPAVLKWYWRRNATLLAIAPTKSSSFILWQVSQGIEPIFSNYSVQDLAKIKVTMKNPYLQKLLQEKWQDNENTWSQIIADNWSVKNLDFLSEYEKDVFLTFYEINPKILIEQAGIRQEFIDQSQSLNIAINPKMLSAKEINSLMLHAWKMWVKSLYYQYNVNAAQEFWRMKECKSCQA